MKINPSFEGIVTSVSIAVVASVLLPVIKEATRPLLISGIRGMESLTDQVKTCASYLREEVEDIVAEAQFERLKLSIDQEIGEGV